MLLDRDRIQEMREKSLIIYGDIASRILSHRVPKIEFDDSKWNGNPKIIINNLFQNVSQAEFCLSSQEREEIRYFSSRLQTRSFQHCTALFSSKCSRWSRSVKVALPAIGARLDWEINIHDSDVTRLSASALYDFCTFHTNVNVIADELVTSLLMNIHV